MSPDMIIGLVLAAALIGGVLLISLGFGSREGRRRPAPTGRSDQGGDNLAIFAAPGVFSDGGNCGPGDGGGSCDGGGGGD